jgi:hypothetical protein
LFTLDKGYKEGDRFQTEVYCREDQSARVCVTVMKNMPHGAIAEEARFTWEFLKQFCRPKGSKKVLNKIGKGESDDRYDE